MARAVGLVEGHDEGDVRGPERDDLGEQLAVREAHVLGEQAERDARCRGAGSAARAASAGGAGGWRSGRERAPSARPRDAVSAAVGRPCRRKCERSAALPRGARGPGEAERSERGGGGRVGPRRERQRAGPRQIHLPQSFPALRLASSSTSGA